MTLHNVVVIITWSLRLVHAMYTRDVYYGVISFDKHSTFPTAHIMLVTEL